MADTHFPDEWLANSLGEVLPPDRLIELRGKAAPGATLWECVVAEKLATDEQILTALSTRFRLKLADVRLIEPSVKEKVPEQLARRFHVLPLRVTDSYLEVATANPFDLRPEKAVDKLLQGMEGSAELVQLADQPAPEEIAISEAEASQRPVVRLVDLIISEGILARSSDIHIEPEEGGVAVR